MTAEDKRPASPKPESLETKFKLLQLLPYDARAKRKHCLVFGFILDWYHSKYGDALASVRHIVNTTKDRDPSGKGLYAGDVHAALTDLVAWGYLDQEKGVGRRASRYVPIWEKLTSVHKIPNTTKNDFSVRENTNTCVRENTYTTDISVRGFTNEDPLTGPGHQTRGLERDIECATPTAPHAVGLVATAAVTAQDEFEKLWQAYGYKRGKPEAKRSFAKLPIEASLSDIIESATAWRDAWAAQGKSDAPRFTLAKWLEREEYDCLPPTAYKPKPGKVKMPRKAVGAVRRDIEIQEVLGSDGFGNTKLSLKWLDAKAGEPEESIISLYGDDYAHMMRDLDVSNRNDVTYKRILLDLHTSQDGTDTYRWHRYPDAENDNLEREGESDDVSAYRHLPWREVA